jgi:group I intron endonuclease
MNSGIYQIKNIVNNKIYIGSTTNSFYKRLCKHKWLLNKNKHQNQYLQNSYNKYGKDNFKYEILATCPKEYCIKLEQWFIDNLKPKYNICKIAGNSIGVKRSDKTKLLLRNINIGKKHSIETINKLKIKNKINYHKYNIKEKLISSKGNRKQIQQFTLENEFIKNWDSAIRASKELNISYRSINYCCRNITKSSNNYKWKYYEN